MYVAICWQSPFLQTSETTSLLILLACHLKKLRANSVLDDRMFSVECCGRCQMQSGVNIYAPRTRILISIDWPLSPEWIDHLTSVPFLRWGYWWIFLWPGTWLLPTTCLALLHTGSERTKQIAIPLIPKMMSNKKNTGTQKHNHQQFQSMICSLSVASLRALLRIKFKTFFIIRDCLTSQGRTATSRWGLHLKGRYTIGNCQRPVFSLGVSQHIHKITNLWKFELNRPSEFGEKTSSYNSFIILVRNYLFFKNYVTSDGLVSTMFYTINSSPMLVTKSVFKIILV